MLNANISYNYYTPSNALSKPIVYRLFDRFDVGTVDTNTWAASQRQTASVLLALFHFKVSD